MYVRTGAHPALVNISASAAIGSMFLPPTLTARRRATWTSERDLRGAGTRGVYTTPSTSLQPQQQELGLLDRELDRDEELHRLGPVDEPVVVGESEVHHRADSDLSRILRVFDRAVLDGVHAEDAGLGRVEDRRGHERPVDAAVGDGEGAALEVAEGQPAVAGA